jgi:hypothetical protein
MYLALICVLSSRGVKGGAYGFPGWSWDNYDRDDGGEIEVTEFLVHDVDPLEILSQMTHMFELKMLIRGLSGDQVRVKAGSDLPKELFVDENFGPQED